MMGNLTSKLSFTFKVTKGTFSRILFGWNPDAYQGDSEAESLYLPSTPSFLTDKHLTAELKIIFTKAVINKLDDDQIVKICRQLEFWYSMNSSVEEMLKLAKNLIDQSLWYKDTSKEITKVPKVRFGKTELQMPVVTCGGMRIQSTWMPDSVPLLRPSRKTVLSGATQSNLKACIRTCLALGINHFETARMYGTSEYQMVEALYDMIQEGEIKREDFIFQTKVLAGKEKSFRAAFNQSWDNIGEKLGYIDLFSLHAISEVDAATNESLEVCEELKRDGKIRHIGFSTHATSEQIMDIINTEKFEYVNIHYHYLWSYHGTGTPDTKGGQGNLACVQRALELDMGVFQISPFDKGGKFYRPSKDFSVAVGKDMVPMEFAALSAWKKCGMHTTSVGIARPSDLDEIMSAARTMALGGKGGVDIDTLIDGCIDRLKSQFETKVGKEWAEKGLLNIPSCYEKSTHGLAIGHILALHNILTGYGMYEFCKDRYLGLEACNNGWKDKKSFEENIQKMSGANAGRCFVEGIDLTEALKNHYNPDLVLQKLREAHKWLNTEAEFSSDDLKQMGFEKGYNLTTWEEMPGEIDSTAIMKVVLQVLTGGRLGFSDTGPGYSIRKQADLLRLAL